MEILPASEIPKHSVCCYLDSKMRTESKPSRVNACEDNTFLITITQLLPAENQALV